MSQSNIDENLENNQQVNVDQNINISDEIELLKTKLELEKDKFLRIIADYENKMKRMQIDAINLTTSKISYLVIDLVSILDDLIKAYEISSEETKEGINLIIKNTKKTLNKHGVEEIVPKEGDNFDLYNHQAISSKASNFEEGKIVEILKTGYKIGDKTIIPAMVITSI